MDTVGYGYQKPWDHLHPDVQVWLSALEQGDFKVAQHMLEEKKVDPNVSFDTDVHIHQPTHREHPQRLNMNALQWAIANDKHEVVQFLVDKVDVHWRNHQDMDALMLAAGLGKPKMVRELLPVSNAKTVTGEGKTALMFALGFGVLQDEDGYGFLVEDKKVLDVRAQCIKALLPESYMVHQDDKGDDALYHAVRIQDTRTVQWILKQMQQQGLLVHQEGGPGMDVSWVKSRRYVKFAVCAGDIQTLKALVDAGADVKYRYQDGSTALSIAVHQSDTKMVKYLLGLPQLELMKRVWLSGEEGLVHMAAKHASVDTFQVLLSACDPQQVNQEEQTLLHVACGAGKEQNVKLLLPLVDVSAYDAFGETALDSALKADHEQVVKVLLEAHPEVANVCNESGNTPLRSALASGKFECASALMAATDHKFFKSASEGLVCTLAVRLTLMESFRDMDRFDPNAYEKGCELLEQLLKEGASLGRSNAGLYAFHAVARGANVPLLQRLWHASGVKDARTQLGFGVVHEAALGEEAPMLSACLDLEPGQLDDPVDGLTPLMWVFKNSQAKSEQMIGVLLDRGASVHVKTQRGNVLEYAVEQAYKKGSAKELLCVLCHPRVIQDGEALSQILHHVQQWLKQELSGHQYKVLENIRQYATSVWEAHELGQSIKQPGVNEQQQVSVGVSRRML